MAGQNSPGSRVSQIVYNWVDFQKKMASKLIKVKDAGSSKLKANQIQGWVAKVWGVEVEDAMVRFGWKRENGPEAYLIVGVKEGRVNGSQWTVHGGLKETVKVKAGHLWGEGNMKYQVTLKPVDLLMREFRHKVAGTEAINMSNVLVDGLGADRNFGGVLKYWMKGGDLKSGVKPARMSGTVIQLVGEDKKYGWGMFPILIAMGPTEETPNLPERISWQRKLTTW